MASSKENGNRPHLVKQGDFLFVKRPTWKPRLEGELGYRLNTLYNFSVKEYQELLLQQGGVCAICFKTPKQNGRQLSLDHDHITGLIRGILCTKCNLNLGKMELDICSYQGGSIDWTKRALVYLIHANERL